MFRNTKIDWNNFTKLRDDNTLKIVAASCNLCNQLIRTPSSRTFENHRRSCTRLRNVEADENLVNDINEPVGDSKSTLDNSEKIKILNQELAKFFFSASISFRQSNNAYLASFIKMLVDFQIPYKPPCRLTLASTILSDVYQEVDEKKKEILDNTDSVLLVDGWKNKSVNRKYLVFSLRNIHTPQTFLSFNDISTETEDGLNLAEHINNAILLAKDRYNTKVYSIVTDNDSKIKRGAQISRTVDGEELFLSTCNSHSANLLLKSFIDQDFTVVLRELLAIFKEPKFEALIIRNGGTKLHNFPDTRFGFFRDTCNSILKNLSILRDLCRDPVNNIREDIVQFVLSDELEDSLNRTVTLMDPICKIINRCQSPNCNVADATELWLSLVLPTNTYNSSIQERIKKAVSDVAYAANYLHPKYQGQKLNENQKEIAKTFLRSKMSTDEYLQLNNYLENFERYDRYREECDDPISYWFIINLTLPKLANFCIKLMLVPASTALLESLFSSWSYVHNIYRNKLGHDKSAQLLDIYHSLRHNAHRSSVDDRYPL